MSAVTFAPIPREPDDDLYPSSDGQPMAETELHGDEMTELKLMLRRHFRNQAEATYVGCNLFVYYEEGNPRAAFSPDVLVVHGAPQRQYDTYKLWKDGPAPSCVIEVSSKKTYVEDRGNKKAICEMLGVTEYFLYDPREEYLHPPLQGFRLSEGVYRPIEVDDRGELPAKTLGLTLSLDARGFIVLRDANTRQRLLRVDEERERAEAERDQEKARAEQAEARLAALLAERDTKDR